MRFNWNACCTPKKCRDYFRRVVTDGPVSRISFSTIERRPCGSEIPVYGTYDAAFDEELKPYIDNLVKARGLVDCPQALRLAKNLLEMLPDEFTLDDYLKLRVAEGYDGDNVKKARMAIRQWMHRGYVVQKEAECDSDSYSFIFRKLKFLNNKN